MVEEQAAESRGHNAGQSEGKEDEEEEMVQERSTGHRPEYLPALISALHVAAPAVACA